MLCNPFGDSTQKEQHDKLLRGADRIRIVKGRRQGDKIYTKSYTRVVLTIVSDYAVIWL